MRRRGKGNTAKQKLPKTRLGLPDLDHSKSAVLDSLRSRESKRGYRHAMDEFIQWYCSEPRLSFNKIVVTRFRIFLENRNLASGTINGRLAAVRRLASEAADAGLLSPELAAGIRRVKGVKKLGVRLGNWLTADEARRSGVHTLAATRGTLGHCRSRRQRRAHSNRSYAGMGKGNDRCLGGRSRNLRGKAISLCLPSRKMLGKRHDRTCDLARGKAICERLRHCAACTSRSQEIMRETLPRNRR